MRRHLPFIVLSLAFGLTPVPAVADILIGTAGPLSGPNAALGEQLRRGAQMAVDDINATGGLNGERLALKALDDGCDPRKAVDVATQFVTDGVKLVAGHYCSGASIPASKVYEQAGIVQISPASTHPKFTDQGGWNVFRICPRDDAQGNAAAALIAARYPLAKLAIVNDQSQASVALTVRLRDALKASNHIPVLDDSYKPGARDYSELVTRIRDAGAEVVYLGGSYVESATLVEELRAMGSQAQFIGSDQLLTDDFWKAAGDAAEGSLVTFMFDPQKFERAQPLLARFRDAGGAPEGHTIYAYAAVQAWVQAATATGSTDGQRVATWLRSGNRLSVVTGDIGFDTEGDLKDPRIAWFRWSDGRYLDVTSEFQTQ